MGSGLHCARISNMYSSDYLTLRPQQVRPSTTQRDWKLVFEVAVSLI